MKRKVANILHILSLLGAICVSFVVICLLFWVLWRGFAVLDMQLFFGNVSPLSAILGQNAVFNGIFPALVGTLWLVILSLLLAIAPELAVESILASMQRPFKNGS
ncbi:MAG: hypothetical protein K2N70_08720 [Helicobacter sp.]|nr:hypothetical protein [Helicobacter sp.]